ncbi:hypothetical protein H6F98_24135 [Microcoleus sp. FACHB-SPT15]|uniref:hypothetical protein n=1 Tax=Microcoleus sp. FACHB-SPT15 TaxID=2692830 RepID=UPI00177FFF47|nr:hypothetical protein [Microcoleus sp. FACHB-SPT15]MBD1808520.1 hypothetical protein [Microcoleus sp. FACHB-SPT15]
MRAVLSPDQPKGDVLSAVPVTHYIQSAVPFHNYTYGTSLPVGKAVHDWVTY